MPSTPILFIGLGVLFLTWDENGFVPDREISLPEASRDGIFYGIYHANLVAALLSSQLTVHKLNYESETLPLFASTSSRHELAAELSIKLRGFTADKCVEHKHRFVSASSLLESILGSVVTENLVAVLGDDLLSRAYPDLLIAYGLIYQDIEAILAGAQRSLHRNGISPTMLNTAEWLIMAMEMFNTGQNSKLSVIIEIKQLLQAFYISLNKTDENE